MSCSFHAIGSPWKMAMWCGEAGLSFQRWGTRRCSRAICGPPWGIQDERSCQLEVWCGGQRLTQTLKTKIGHGLIVKRITNHRWLLHCTCGSGQHTLGNIPTLTTLVQCWGKRSQFLGGRYPFKFTWARDGTLSDIWQHYCQDLGHVCHSWASTTHSVWKWCCIHKQWVPEISEEKWNSP